MALDPRFCPDCQHPFIPRAHNQARCDACRSADGVIIYSDFEPTRLSSFYHCEDERRQHRKSLRDRKTP